MVLILIYYCKVSHCLFLGLQPNSITVPYMALWHRFQNWYKSLRSDNFSGGKNKVSDRGSTLGFILIYYDQYIICTAQNNSQRSKKTMACVQ